MTRGEAARPDAGRASEAGHRSERGQYTTRRRLKRAIVFMGARGIIPPALACWIIERGGLAHD